MAQTVQVTYFTVTPGMELDFIDLCVRAKKLHMRLGATNVILARVMVGANPGQFIYNLAFESAEAYGKFADTVSTDSEWLALWAEGVKRQVGTASGSRLSTLIDI